MPSDGRTPSCWWITGHAIPYWPQACMNIERQVQQRSMLAFWPGDGRISGSAPGISSGSSIGSALASV